MMMSCDKKLLLKCQQCLFLRLFYCQQLLFSNICITGEYRFSRYVSYHIPNFFDRGFMIDFRNVRSP